jgi:acetoacetyl-CoA reductase/3-oxoacyl-[acyl-carrier protein] reductase
MPAEFEGLVAAVTGGASGIGAAIVSVLRERGARVAVLDRAPSDVPDGVLAVRTDVSDDASVRTGIDHVVSEFGRLDILVNNAGITSDKTVFKMADEDWQKVLDVNLSGAFFLSKAALEHMIERGTGRIINISSIIGQTGNIGQANYAASKSGLFGLTMTFAKEAAFALGKAGKLEGNDVAITVNAIAPGFIETDMLSTVPEKVLDGIRAQVPLRRLGKPEEIARAAYFLAGDESAYINGAVIAVNGGMDM